MKNKLTITALAALIFMSACGTTKRNAYSSAKEEKRTEPSSKELEAFNR